MKTSESSSKLNANFKRARVLVVEDNDDQWVLIQEAMQQCLREVTTFRASTAQEALTLLNEWCYQTGEAPRLILLDLYLPNREDGWFLLEQLKAMPAPYNQIPVVMLSSSATSADINEAYSLGVSSYLVKPVNFPEWITCFQHLRAYWWETTTLPTLQYIL